MKALAGKRILLCVGGGIAAYKTPEIVRRLVSAGASVQVAMTEAATRFIAPLTLQTLSKSRVATDLLDATEEAAIGHIRIAEQADAVLVAPATADLVARMVAGQADDVVTAALLATRAPVIVAPSMNTNMLEHPAVRRNLEQLRAWTHRIVEPDVGELACGYEGRGRLPDADVLVEEVATALTAQDLAGRRVLVSAGPTREPLDPVRFLTNRSSGRMGYAVAAAARRRGAVVTLVSGPTALRTPGGCEVVNVETAAEMNEAMRARITAAEVVVMVAAVADYRPARVASEKIKKTAAELQVELTKTDDILAGLAAARGRRVVVGFAAETDNVRENARKKLESKSLDLVVANDVTAPGSGFDVDTNAAVLIDRAGNEQETGVVGKDELADAILDRVSELLQEQSSRSSRRLEKLGK
jgi:phosphopantothenoylcysteine decarboxylase/phosphopantothenate--cysteine ligase